MYNVRTIGSDEAEVIRAVHAKLGNTYGLPSLDSPLFALRHVAENGQTIVAASAVKLIGEVYLCVDPDLPEEERSRALAELNFVCTEAARQLGLDEISSWVSPEAEQDFIKALGPFGWRRSPWPTYSVEV